MRRLYRHFRTFLKVFVPQVRQRFGDQDLGCDEIVILAQSLNHPIEASDPLHRMNHKSTRARGGK